MKIEAGKSYRTRDGRKALVAGKHPRDKQLWIGFLFTRDGWPETHSWREDGVWHDINTNSHYNIVAEWVEPAFAWFNINRAPNGGLYLGRGYNSRTDADILTDPNRVGCGKLNLADYVGRWDEE